MARWWEQDMSDAGQGLFADPNLALQVATMPSQLLATQQATEDNARAQRGGLIQQAMKLMGAVGHKADGVLANVIGRPGANAVENVGKAIWYPVDKAASGAYWLYSNAISQPISTALLMGARTDFDTASWFSGKDWADTWHKANDISPAQAFANYENVAEATDKGTDLSGFFGSPGGKLSTEQQNYIKQNKDAFLYDSEYWRNKAGWKYTIGTGALDGFISMGADPAYAGIKVASSAIKAGRSIEVAGQAAEKTKSISGFNMAAEKVGQKIGQSFAKTPEQISQGQKVEDFFKWSDGKSAWEIAQHPIWGSGRRVNPAAEQISSVLAHADDVEKPLLLRFAMGDNDAAAQLASKNKDLMGQVGRMVDNRQAVSSAKYDPAIFDHFMEQERAGRTSPAAVGGPGIGGTSPAALPTGQLVEPPYPRPTTPGPRQAGWDATYGNLAKQAQVQRQAVGDILKSGNGVRPMGAGAAATSFADSLRFDSWKAAQLDSLGNQIGRMQEKEGFYRSALGDINAGKGVEDFSPGASNIFGTMKQAYRMGPLALRDTEAAANRSITAQTVDRYGRQASGGFVARTIRQGYYTIPLRVVQSFGDRLPQNMVNHNDTDAASRVLDMLKRVPGLGQDARVGMVNQYSMATDKIAKAEALKAITSQVVDHMAQNVHGLDEVTAKAVNDMIETGTTGAMNSLKGQATPSQQMFAAPGASGARADKIEDGEGYLVSPVAKTQLSYAEPLLDVKELDRILSRNSGYLQSLKSAGGATRDGVMSIADTFSNLWKAGTLLRPGYTLRAPSEEIAASAIKFGMISAIGDSVHGGANWMRNRAQQLSAISGKGSYMSTVGGTGHVQILDPGIAQAALARGDKVTKINVNKAWPVIMSRIDSERDALTSVEKSIAAMEKDTSHDPLDLAALRAKASDHQSVLDEHRDYANEILRQATDSGGRRLGEGTIEHQGITVPQAFSREWDNPIPRDQISSDEAMHTAFARGEAIDTARMIKTGNWVGVTPDMPNHMSSWLDALNKQWRQDDLFKLVASDPTLKTAAAWLKTPAGRVHLGQLGVQGRDPGRLLNGVRDTLDSYLPVGTGLRAKLAAGEEITEQELRSAISKDDFPTVHGEETKGLTASGSKETAARLVDDLINKGFEKLGTIPTDIMSRHPTYLRAQEARMRQMIDQELSFQKAAGQTGDSISTERLNQMLKKSDTMARKDISQIVYDPTRTTATQALRFVSPFLAAHVDGLERWAGLIAEKPQFVSTASKIYNAPVAANLITDNQGNHVDENGMATITDPVTGKTSKKFVGIQDRMIHLRVPGPMQSMMEKLTGNGKGVDIKVQALNTILPGDPWWNPGTGPLVTVAASKLAQSNPAMGDFLQWAKVLPYGPQGFMDSMTPAYMKDIFTAFNTDDTKYQQTMLQEYQRQVADYHNGGPVPDIKKAEANAKSFYFLKAFTNWLSPARTSTTPLSGTPYQFYVDQYKAMQSVDPKNADTGFLAKYGEDYFVFATSLNKSMGIAPTLSALNTSKQYSDLIAGDPSLAPFIIGDVYNKGDFSPTAYAIQQNQKIGGEPVRSQLTVQQALEDNQRKLGWAAYNKLMSGVDAALIRAGFSSYTQKGAEGFLAVKQSTQQGLQQMYPAWEQDFNTTDKGAMARKIKSFEILVQDDRLKNDPMRQDIPYLTLYLNARNMYQKALATRPAKTLTYGVDGTPTGTNADIGQSWRAFQFGLVTQSTKFADVFHRYLENDNLQ